MADKKNPYIPSDGNGRLNEEHDYPPPPGVKLKDVLAQLDPEDLESLGFVSNNMEIEGYNANVWDLITFNLVEGNFNRDYPELRKLLDIGIVEKPHFAFPRPFTRVSRD